MTGSTNIESWDQLEPIFEKGIQDSLTTKRIVILKAIQQLLNAIPESDLTKISLLLLKTYNYYHDADSRNELLKTLQAIADAKHHYLSGFIKFINHQVSATTLAITDYLSLLYWINTFNVDMMKYGLEKQDGELLVRTQAIVLNKCIEYEGVKKHQHRRRVHGSAIHTTKTSIVDALTITEDKEAYIELIVKSITKNTADEGFSILGALNLAIIELVPTIPSLTEIFASKDKEILEYYSNQGLLNKIAPSVASLELFGTCIESLVTVENFTSILLPNIEKAVLRSSENSFGVVLPVLFKQFPKIDISEPFVSSKLLTSIISGFKSTKENVREGAFKVTELILLNNFTDSSIETLGKFVDEILKALKSTSNADSKALIVKTLSYLPSKVSGKIIKSLLPLVSKDINETSLSSLVKTFIQHAFKVLDDNDLSSQITKELTAGLSHAKQQLRRIWFIEFGEQIFTNNNESEVKLLNNLFPTLVKSLEPAQQSPLPTLANKGIVCAFVTIAVSKYVEVDAGKIYIPSLKAPGLLTSSKIYTKLTEAAELSWYLRAIAQASGSITELEEQERVDYGLAWVYMLSSNNVMANIRLTGNKLVKQVLETVPELSDAIIKACYKVLKDFEIEQHMEVFNFALKNFSVIFASLTQLNNQELVRDNIQKLAIIANHAQATVNNGWIGLAQRSNMKLDLGDLIKENHSQILKECALVTSDAPASGKLYQAAIKAIGNIAFIQPAIVSPILSNIIKENLDVEKFSSIDNETLKIYNGKEGELVIDVLNKDTKKQVEDKNSKDYEIKKWEESIKKEIASKKAPAKKLTKEEILLVNQQIAEESKVRNEVKAIVGDAHYAVSIITELTNSAKLVENGASLWFPVAVIKLLEFCKLELVVELFHSSPVDAYLNLSSLISSRLALLKQFVGVATLRSYSVQGLSENLTQEPLLALVGRILYRIKILADQKPLDSLSLSYILPLLTKVLHDGKSVAIKNASKTAVTSEFVEEDPEEEQLLLAIEIISAHADSFEDEGIPRSSILEVLISLMKLPSKAKLSKDCFLSLCQHVSINISESDLQLLLSNIVTPEVFVRSTILEGIDAEFDLQGEIEYSNELWVATHDNDSNCKELANTIWEDNNLHIIPETPKKLLELFGNHDSGLRVSIATAYVDAVNQLRQQEESVLGSCLDDLIELYHEKKNPPAPKLDKFGLVIKSTIDQRDRWEERSTIALALKLLAPVFDKECIEKLFNFLVHDQALGDKEGLVRQELQEAGIETINLHGSKFVESLIPIFEENLAAKNERSKVQDSIKESVIILYGSLARHLETSDPRLKIIVDRLIKTLDTPSEKVQFAVSECIAPLVPSFESRLQEFFDLLTEKLFTGKSLPIRKGAAYGIAGLVKGSGIKTLSSFDIIRELTDAADDKKNPTRREGVSIAFECLSRSLGKFFEPYVIEVLPIILKSLGDSVPEVRDSTDRAAKQIMKNTTSFGVKKLIPLAISNLDEIAWRSKKGSVELLGSMAYLDPTQLSASLSTIVPEIVGVLNDTHKEVRKAAEQSLKRFGEVIRNPEIQAIVPDLINAIGDPTKYTDDALDKLIKTQFVHYIDGPSLALIIHVIHRGMKDRSASTKKKACQIVGNMAILVDAKDLRPYLNELVGELEIAMVDPVPATRSTAARALGSLVEKLGEEQFPTLIPNLLATLQDERKAGDRLGSAQALAEVICGLGINKLEELLPNILASASSPRSHIRAGFMPLLLFLPVCFGSQFSPYLNKIIPPILNGLADQDEEIRDTALRAGRLIVKNYAKKAVDLLLPELELGLSDPNYRIRLSSVELTGDLLFQITGISGKNELSEDQFEVSGEVNKTLVEVLGQDRRDRVLASLFVSRADVAGIVRNAAVDIWKALVANTPRTVKEILPSLTAIIVRKLASGDDVERTIAAQSLGEMVRRVGSNALEQLLPTLEESFDTTDKSAKQGICIALTELIKSTPTEGLYNYQETFISIIKQALVDSDSEVREAAAQAFEGLQTELGKVVIDEVLPDLLKMLEGDDSQHALLALKDIMATKADVIFPILIPTLLAPPMDAFKASAISSLASVAGSALYRRLSLIINTLVNAVVDSNSEPEETQKEITNAFDKILLAIDDDEGVHPLMQQLMALVKHEDSRKRAAVFQRLGNFFTHTNLDYSAYLEDMVSQFILSLGDPASEVVEGAFESLSALVKRQPKESLEHLVKPARQALDFTGVRGEDLAGFKLPKGPNCILPIFLHGLMYGNSDQKEASAFAIADIINKTPDVNLKPFATTMTGPLIRVIGEKVNSDIKAAILVALNSLLLKIPQFLRPFIPQLQRTFVRSLSDASNEKLRARAVVSLGSLIKFQPRVDSLITELVTGAKNSNDKGVKASMLKGMLEVVNKAGKSLSEDSKTSIMSLIEDEITVVDDKSAVSYARLLGSLAGILSIDEARNILKSKILEKVDNSNDKFCVLSINSFLKYSPDHIFNTGLLSEIVDFVLACSDSTIDYISDNATVAIGKLLLLHKENKSPFSKEATSIYEVDEESLDKLVRQLCVLVIQPKSSSPDTRRLALVVLRTVARLKFDEVHDNLDLIVPSIFASIRDPIIPIKLAAEKAYLAVFQLVEDQDMKLFNQWFEGKSTVTTVTGTSIVPRSIGDYTKRVASRLAGVERERIEAGGDAETMFSDRFEDETEVWAVGGTEIAST
ncbi:translational activator of GCN4 [Spathaspora passalidarum NRRL Y-27907]|uniref:eIF-2-alpha kinase activator GCN1 n=1 Tax=Spathaspora passalidarum (strain NRRL Y-27907 / 11-Y1) TaxID=619300 RepID=G3ALT0_SPAPN|nr:translational activator of GCN4 [Spathaspora passalidarum NRRL Y-27907]EGW32689.1 translational activator of GCN4 [Spathaspora passalidarum NRRL Y-27907]